MSFKRLRRDMDKSGALEMILGENKVKNASRHRHLRKNIRSWITEKGGMDPEWMEEKQDLEEEFEELEEQRRENLFDTVFLHKNRNDNDEVKAFKPKKDVVDALSPSSKKKSKKKERML